MENILGQTFGVIATIITFVMYQLKTKKAMFLLQIFSIISMCLSFFFLDAATGLILNIVCLIRNVCFYFQQSRSKMHIATSTILTIAIVALGFWSWQGWFSLFMILALAINTLFMTYGSPQGLRASVLLTSSMIIVYNIFATSYGGITNEAVSIVSSVIGICRYKKTPKGQEI